MAELKNRGQVEGQFAAKLGVVAARHRKALVVALGSPPNPERIPDTFWQAVEDETREALLAMLALVFVTSAIQHGLAGRTATILGQAWAAARAATVAKGYRQHSEQRATLAGQQWGGQATPPTAAQVDERAASIFGPTRVNDVVVSETTLAVSQGGEAAVEETVGFSEDDQWVTEDDNNVCPICWPFHRKPREVWAAKFPDGPPAHVRCRCWLVYAKVPA